MAVLIIGTWSGRRYDASAIGLPIRTKRLDYMRVRLTWKAIDVVRTHLSRFDQPDEELAMLHLLEQRLRTGAKLRDVDRRFLTHELREYVRYRHLGWRTGQPSTADDAYELWNNLHTATLEEYNLKEGPGVLFG